MEVRGNSGVRGLGLGMKAWLLLAGAFLVLVGFVGYDLYAEYQRLGRMERERLSHQVRLAQENLGEQLRATSRTLEAIRSDLPDDLRRPDATTRLSARLASTAASMRGVRSFLVIDAQGRCIASNRAELVGQSFRNGDRYNTMSQGNDPGMLYLSAPFLTPLKTWAMSAGRVVQDSQGRFDGYVLAILDPEYFSLVMRSVLFAPDMRAAVVHWDGMVVQREPDPEGLIGEDISQNPRSLFAQYLRSKQPAGVYEGISGVTGSDLLAMLGVIRPQDLQVDKPLVFGASRDLRAIYAPWYDEVRARLTALGLLGLTAVGGLVSLQRRQRQFDQQVQQQEGALALRQSQLDTFVAHAPAALALFDREMRYVMASQRWLADFGLAGREVEGQCWYELQPSVPARWKTVHRRAFAGEVVRFDEDFLPRPDGSLQWLRWEARPAQSLDGQVQTIVIFCEDISHEKREELRLREAELRWRFAIDGSELGLWDWDVPAAKVFFSPRWKAMRGYSEDEIGNDLSEWESRLHPEDLPRVKEKVDRLLAGEIEFYSTEFRMQCKDGSYRWVLDRGKALRRDDQGRALRVIGTHTDLTELKRREAELELNAGVFRHSAEGIIICGPDNRIASVNEAFTQITGYEPKDVAGHNPRLLASGRHDRAFYAGMWQQILEVGFWQGEIWNRRRNGDLFVAWLTVNVDRAPDGTVRHYYAVFSDITQRRQTEARLQHLTHHDALTDLPNVVLLRDRIDLAIGHARGEGHGMAVLFVDLDRFKNINDSLGLAAGDRLLVEVSHRLRQVVGEQDTVSRRGGDDFTLLLSPCDAETAAHRAQAVMEALSQPVTIEQQSLVVTASIGIALFPGDGDSTDLLMQAADTALYRAKADGGNTLRFHAPDMHQRVSRALTVENGLRQALERNELLLHYQPQVDASSGRLAACEALVRWQHPVMGLVAPGDFIPVAEESGLILPLGEWVMRTAAAQAKAWQDAGHAPFVMAVNVSAVQFAQDEFPDQVRRVLEDSGLAPQWLEIELTESVVTRDPQRAILTIERLHELGVQLSIDDFGTGYSSLAYLRRFRIHKLKIDQSFVRDLVSDANSASIATAIISLAHGLGLGTVAEGVETQAQCDWLVRAGCEQLQGFLFSRPLAAPAFEQRVLTQATLRPQASAIG